MRLTTCCVLILGGLLLAPAFAGTSLGTSESGHYITFRGAPRLLVGDSGTQCVLQNAALDYPRWLDDCAAEGLSAVHVWSFVAPRQQLDGSDLEDRYGYVYPGMTPWARKTAGARAHDGGFQWDLFQWDEGETADHYWPRLRDLCARTQELELVLGITVFWGWPKHPGDWAYHPFNTVNGGPVEDTPNPLVTEVQMIASPGVEVYAEPWDDSWSARKKCQWHWERYCAKLIEATAPFDNVFFVFMDEHSYSEGNGGDHFRAFFQQRGCRWVDWNARRTEVDYVFDRIAHDKTLGRNPGAIEDFAATPARPVMVLEDPPYVGAAVRLTAWSTLLGGVGYFYHDDAEQETVHTGIMGYDPKVQGGDTGAERRRWLGHAGRFFKETAQHLDAMRPTNAVTDAGIFCLANPGEEYALYLPMTSGPETGLDLAGTPGSFVCRFLDPRTGAWHAPETREGNQRQVFRKPVPEEDWVLHVIRQPRNDPEGNAR